MTHAPDWLILAWGDVICYDVTSSPVSANQIARKSPACPIMSCAGGCVMFFFMFLSAIIFLWFVRFSYFFLWKYVINSLDFGCLTTKLSPHRFPCLFDHFLIFFWAQKQFFPFYYFPCPLFKLAVNGSSRNGFCEIQSEKIISNEVFSDEIFASAIKKR